MMEALEEPPVTNASEGGVKTTSDKLIIGAETPAETDVCHTSNGLTNFTESDDVGVKDEQETESVVETTENENVDELVTKFEEDYNNMTEAMETEVVEISSAETDNAMYVTEVIETEIGTEIHEAESTGVECIDGNIVIETEVVEESVVEVDGIVDNSGGNITFETEILENNISEPDDETSTCNEPDSSNILSELGQNIELSEVLRSSDVSETVENNNCEQEVFNKEELLDILEGNDVEESRKMISENFHADSQKLEEHLAMQQLNRLKSNDSKKRNRFSPKKPEKKQPKRSGSHYLPRETRAKVDETTSSKTPSKEAKAKSDETAGSKLSPKEAKGMVDDTAVSKMSPKEAKGKVDDTSGSKNSLKEAKGKIDDTASSKMSSKEAKGKVDDTASSKTSPKETKGKVDDTSSSKAPKETKGKVEETASSKLPKEVKGRINDSAFSKISPKEAKGKADDTPSSKFASKGKEDNTASSKMASKESKGKAEETASLKIASKEDKVKVNDTASSNNIPKEGKTKIDESNTSNNAAKQVKGKGDDKSIARNVPKTAKENVSEIPKTDSIVNALVQDWSDDENMEPDESNTLLNESEALLESTEDLAKSQESIVLEDSIQDEIHEVEITENNADVSVSEETTPNNKSGDEAQPQRRLGRVIKKKVIYDPDNPDTFTKTKVHIKKEKEVLPEKEQSVPSTPKKMKIDHPPQAPKTKSPVSKMQWKKPQPKSIKQSSKRLTEIDRLLMDEGAVNMICQLTPEALKGNKNMKSRAEFIKNIQSNTPDTKEMKFRERKNKLKSEDEPRKPGGKHRLSLSSSVKSPAISEDFENHSADDSIIYRRHSSSSYSSSCMSPRRLSDVDGGASQVPNRESTEPAVAAPPTGVFMEAKMSTPKRDIMNKSDCLSIKEKLNSKLSQALNKRKLTGFKSEKPSKVKKLIQIIQNEEVSTDVTLNLNQKVAEICIHKGGSLFNVQVRNMLQ